MWRHVSRQIFFFLIYELRSHWGHWSAEITSHYQNLQVKHLKYFSCLDMCTLLNRSCLIVFMKTPCTNSYFFHSYSNSFHYFSAQSSLWSVIRWTSVEKGDTANMMLDTVPMWCCLLQILRPFHLPARGCPRLPAPVSHLDFTILFFHMLKLVGNN